MKLPLSDSLILMLRSCTNLASPPAVAAKIIELSSCETSGLTEVAEVVSIDSATSAKLLRMANSPLYARQRSIENLRQAILLFGLNGTLNIALGFSLKQNTSGNDETGLNYNTYWKRSLASAMFAQEVAEKLNCDTKENAFLAGLLQDIGMLALDRVDPTLYKDLDAENMTHDDFAKHEKSKLGADHSVVGAWLLKEWHIPEKIITTILNSHNYEANKSKSTDVSIKAVCAASILADAFITDLTTTPNLILDGINKVKTVTGLSEAQLNNIIETVSSNYSDLADMFDIELDNPQMYEFISEQAREIMTLRNLNQIKEHEDLQEKAEMLEEISKTDSLTHLYSRRHFDETVQTEFHNAKQHHWPLGLLFVDLDFFKKVNDTYGHDIGDLVLTRAAGLLQKCIRDTDVACRYGGEEFTVILPGATKEGVEITCDRIVKAFRKNTIELKSGETINITVSTGAFVFESGNIEDWTELVKIADRALYKAKNSGRNQFCLVTDTKETELQLKVS